MGHKDGIGYRHWRDNENTCRVENLTCTLFKHNKHMSKYLYPLPLKLNKLTTYQIE